MRISIFMLLFLLGMQSLFSQAKTYGVENTEWLEIENSLSEDYPLNGSWVPKKFKTPVIVPAYRGQAPQLKNFEIHPKAFPNMMDIAIGPPAEGIYRADEKELSRFVEFINEKSFETDNNIEYYLPLEGQWGLNNEFRNSEHLFQFITGAENWIEIIAANRLLASGKGSLVASGSIFPATGDAVIRVSAIDTNNKGLIDVKIYSVYEKMCVDPFHKALSEKWFSPEKSKSLKWLSPSDAAHRQSPWLPEDTPALYKRTYQCNSEAATKNVYYSLMKNISHMWINGKAVDINNSRIPDNTFTVGENEVIYYSDSCIKGVSLNLEFFSVRPYWLKTSVEATKDSVMTALIRGVNSKVYINGKYAGVIKKEKDDEFLGYGLFKDGKNEIAICALQNNPKTFIENITVDKADSTKALVLPWKSSSSDVASPSPGTLSAYDGFYLQWKPGVGIFTSGFSGKSSEDMELIFDSGKRFPDWMFQKELFVPNTIVFNGKTLNRTGNSFVLKAADMKDKNTLQFSFVHGGLPEPLLYTASEAKPKGFFRFKQSGRFGRERLKPSVYFVGEKVNYILDIDFSMFDKVSAEFAGSKTEFSLNSKQTLTLDLKKAGRQQLNFTVTRQGRSMTVPGDVFYVMDFPENKNEWLQKNKAVTEILIGSDAFYNSETTLFPEFHQKEWMLRELKTDSKSLEFGPLSSWKEKEKFSVFDSFPNGVPVMEKFGRRMETYMKLRSRSYPVLYTFENNIKTENLWNSAAVTFQYLRWLEEQKVKVDWTKETLDDYIKAYVEGMKEKAAEYMSFREKIITEIIKKLALNAAPGSTFRELKK